MKNILIIGSGVVGLAIAYELSKKIGLKVFVLEKNKNIGLENTSKNSEIIHAGVYYKTNFLKRKLAIEGKKLIYKFCKKHKIRHARVGKLFIAKNKIEEKYLHLLKKQSLKNGLKDCKFINYKKLKKMEPNVIGHKALMSPSSGIFDVKSFISKLYKISKKNSVKYKFKSKNLKIIKKGKYFIVNNFKNVSFDYIINSAGINAIKIAKKNFPNEKFPKDRFVRGLYFRTKQNLKINKIIYQAQKPNTVIPRVDIVPMLGGGYLFGPNVQKSKKISKVLFFNVLRKNLRFIDKGKLKYFKQGIRTKITVNNKIKNEDFFIKKLKKYNWINLFGIESPGLTSSLSIAKYVYRNFIRNEK